MFNQRGVVLTIKPSLHGANPSVLLATTVVNKTFEL